MDRKRRKSRCEFCGKDLRETSKIIKFAGGLEFCSEECHSYYRQRR